MTDSTKTTKPTVVRRNGLSKVVLVALVRTPIMLPFWLLARIGEWSEGVCEMLNDVLPGLTR